jgi:alkylresorcinol/alkylpyrone synthase
VRRTITGSEPPKNLDTAQSAAPLRLLVRMSATSERAFFTSLTGICSPSIDARLINRMGLSPNIRRVPMFGLGCVAGAAGIARAADYVRAYPGQVAVILAVELCSLTLQRHDMSMANLISSGLFGDGAADVVVVGSDCGLRGPKTLGTRSVFYPDTEKMMGWDVSEKAYAGLEIFHRLRFSWCLKK